jgi:hypothetical protein
MDSASGIPVVIGQSSPEPTTSLAKTLSAASKTRRQSWLDSTSPASMRFQRAQVSLDMVAALVNPSATARASVGLAGPPHSSIAARRNCRSRSSSATRSFGSSGTRRMFSPCAHMRPHIGMSASADSGMSVRCSTCSPHHPTTKQTIGIRSMFEVARVAAPTVEAERNVSSSPVCEAVSEARPQGGGCCVAESRRGTARHRRAATREGPASLTGLRRGARPPRRRHPSHTAPRVARRVDSAEPRRPRTARRPRGR